MKYALALLVCLAGCSAFSEAGHATAAGAAKEVCLDEAKKKWDLVKDAGAEEVLADLRACQKQADATFGGYDGGAK